MARKNITLENKEVIFAAVTGEGIDGQNGQQYSLAVKVDDEDIKAIREAAKELEKEAWPKDAKRSSNYDLDSWFKEEEDGDGTVLWLNRDIDANMKRPLGRKRAPGTDYTMKEFETLGKGSVVDVSMSLYSYEYKGRYGIGRGLNGLVLKEYVPYEGGDDGLEGEDLNSDVPSAPREKDKYANLIEEIEDAISESDKDEAKELLHSLPKDHPTYKALKKRIKAL